MNRYVIRYYDQGGNGWSRFLQADSLKDAITAARHDPEITKIKDVVQLNNHRNHADL